MADNHKSTFTIIGGGLAGGLMAVYLGRAGYTVDVYEQRSDLRKVQVGRGRSINLALSTRGIDALREAGLDKEVLAAAVPMRGRMLHMDSGEQQFQPYSKNPDEYLNSVSRRGLNELLLNAAERTTNVSLHFEQKCTSVDLKTGRAKLKSTSTGVDTSSSGDILVGADGAFSAVRRRMQRIDRFDFSQSYLKHGYRELTIPATSDGTHVIEPNALHIWPRRSYMMIALPNADGSFTCTLFWPFEGRNSFAELQTEAQVLSFFHDRFPDAAPLMPTLAEDFLQNPTGSLVTIKCGPWYTGDRVVLIGDACHAVVPFYGQGINAGFEDCTALKECIDQEAPDWRGVFDRYYHQRKPHLDALAELAIHNFVEMRDRVGSPAFLRQKERERMLHRIFPNWYLPLYSMITFSRIPYADAVYAAERQQLTIRNTWRTVLTLVVLLLIVWFLWI